MRSRIAHRLLIGFLLVSPIPMALLAYVYLSAFEHSLRQNVVAQLSSLADKKADQIDNYVNERMADARDLAQTTQLRRTLRELGEAFRAGGMDAPAYVAATGEHWSFWRDYLQVSRHYHDILVIDHAGNVVFSVAREQDLGTNLLTGPFRDSGLADSYRQTMDQLSLEFTTFRAYAPSGNQAAAFLVMPIMENGQPFGAFALQFNLDRLEPVVTDRTGLGQTGETVLAQRIGANVLYTAPLRGIEDAAFRYQVPLHQAAWPMQEAQAGERGGGVMRDYVDTEVVAAWRYLPALHWGMVVKIDAVEALMPAANLRNLTWAALGILSLVAATAAFFFVHSIVQPIQALMKASTQLAEGDLNRRVSIQKEDELGQLARAFNRMAANIEQSHAVLEQRVAARTAELSLMASVYQNSVEAILISDKDNKIISVNHAFTRLMGFSSDDVADKDSGMLTSSNTPTDRVQDLWMSLKERGYWQGELCCERKDGSVFPTWVSMARVHDGDGRLTHFVASFIDITEQKVAEERIRHLAHHDTLTGLPNRLNLQNRLDQALAAARRNRRRVAVMFIDMDRFKLINDTLGHHIGDGLLIEVARRLQGSVRDSDVVARLGGDEFMVVLSDIEDACAIAGVANKLMQRLSQPYCVDGHDLLSTPSIGISVFPDDGDNAEALMKNADSAMYHAKAQGRNNHQFYTDRLNEAAVERLRLEQQLRQGLKHHEFVLYYQPLVEISGKRVVGMEALVRWRHPEAGMVPPSTFIPVAEETGLILPLGDWVLEESCRQLRAWKDAGTGDLHMSVNISARQLRTSGLSERVAELLETHGLNAGDLQLEITESMAMEQPERTIDTLRRLREEGVSLAIDDFGTGYSSLSYLKMLPINLLKLDGSFVKDIQTDPNDAAICAATIALAHKLKLKVVAEGVETEAQRDYLAEQGCDFLQGYLYSKPVPADKAALFVWAHSQFSVSCRGRHDGWICHGFQ
ncbi:MAG: hypothetical protein C1943_12890 [Halochromatium sp.]|nr:hypothetical protein [Halochromatium sp.]